MTFVPGVILYNRWFAVVIDARVSRKVGRDINKRITSRRDPRPIFLDKFLHRYLDDEFAFALVSPPGSIATFL